MPTLSADVARSNPQIRDAYKRKMLALVHKMSNILDVAGPDRRRRAWSIVAMMIGAIAISRAMPDGEEADQALDSALQTAAALVAPKQIHRDIATEVPTPRRAWACQPEPLCYVERYVSAFAAAAELHNEPGLARSG
jgi:hypothetical protein